MEDKMSRIEFGHKYCRKQILLKTASLLVWKSKYILFPGLLVVGLYCQGAPTGNFEIVRDSRIKVNSSMTWELPAVDRGQKMILKIKARRESTKFGGWAPIVKYELNGKALDATLNRHESILLNQRLSFQKRGKTYVWNKGEGIWLAMFSPNFKKSSSYTIPVDDPFTYELDLSTLVIPGKKNTFSASNLATPAMEKKRKCSYTLHVNLEATVENCPTDTQTNIKQIPELGREPELKIIPGGAFSITAGNIDLVFESSFSQPGGGWNHLSATKCSSVSPQWVPTGKTLGRKCWEVSGQTASYRLARKIIQEDNRFDIEDTLCNISSSDLAIRFDNKWKFNGIYVPFCRIGGQPGQAINNVFSPENPTLFLPLKNSAVGITVNDNVYRNQAKFYYDAKSLSSGAANNRFALAPGKSYTVKWSVYILPTDNYYDFINQVRKTWGTNYLIPGPICWISYDKIIAMKDKTLEKLVKKFNVRYICFWEMISGKLEPAWNGMKTYGYGSVILTDVFKPELQKMKQAAEKLRRVVPQVKIAPYSHCFYQGLERPDDPAFKDSWTTYASGKRCRRPAGKGVVPFQLVYPTLTNSFGKIYRKIIHMYIRDIKINWLYWDESSGGSWLPDKMSTSKATYSAWDGYSADIDLKTNTIIRKYALIALISNDFIISIADIFRQKGTFVLFNGGAKTRERMVYPCMTEAYDDFSRVYALHLCSPLVYPKAAFSIKLIRKYLRGGALLVKSSLSGGVKALAKCYPLTIMELHSGWIKGKERIITSQSGKFGWQGKFGAKLYIYDKNDKILCKPELKHYNDYVDIVVPDEGLVIIEKATENRNK
jgi:hypothetical protein